MKYLLLIIILFGCSKYKYQSGRSLKPYVYEFEHQANKRGVRIEWDGLRIISKTNLKNNRQAYYSPNTHIVYVDITSSTWKINAEELMMHELGHAVLKRDHLFKTLNNNPWLKKSVMGWLAYPTFSSVDSMNYRKDYYYDELFNIHTPEPEWVY